MFRYSFVILLGSALLAVDGAEKPEVKSIDSKHPYEVSARGKISLKKAPSLPQIKKCIPRESMAFPEKLPSKLRKSVFREDEFEDLKDCTKEDCAFNFFTAERRLLDQNSDDPKKLKDLYFQFFKDRVAGRTPLDPRREKNFIRSKDEAFQLCQDPKIDQLLDNRPLKTLPFRLSHVHYDDQMRPTTRLLQGLWVTKQSQTCYVEATLFADHYDVDRVEVWSIEDKNLELQVRHRIDLLNSWIRRLNKPSFYKTLKEILRNQISQAAECLNR